MMDNNTPENLEETNVLTPRPIRKWVSFGIFVALIVFAALTIMQSRSQSPAASQLVSDTPFTEAETQALLAKVATRLELPDEVPLIAEVQNADALRIDQPFYAQVENGDIVLLFASKAVLYRPSDDIIVNVGPLLYVDPSKLEQQ